MMDRSPFFAACCIAATAVSVLLSGCNSAESRARQAYTEYQAASAAGDLQGARIALLQLVTAQDDVPSYWEELGKLQLELHAYPDAYYAFNRAHELDRTNAGTLAAMTQLALLGGNMDIAEQNARQLELLSPGHPAVRLAYGYVALRRTDLDKADEEADQLIENFPFDPSAKLLKARILMARGDAAKAVALLQDQVRSKPNDIGSLKALMTLLQHESDWRGVADVAARLGQLQPKDKTWAVTAVDAAFRANDIVSARRESEPLLTPAAAPDAVADVLDVWAKRWKTPEAIAEIRRVASRATPQQRLAFATYFNEVGSPEDAQALAGGGPQLPINATNMSANAIIADAIGQMGQASEAKRLFDAILAREPDHVYALRGRIKLEIRTGRAKAAISDAQRLISVLPGSAPDRLLLARAYAAAGDARQLDRTLWDAFHEIPGNLELYEVLRAHVRKTQGEDAVKSVDDEYRQQRDVNLAREFI